MEKEIIDAWLACDGNGDKSLFYKEPTWDDYNEMYDCPEYEAYHAITDDNEVFAITNALKRRECKKVRITMEVVQ